MAIGQRSLCDVISHNFSVSSTDKQQQNDGCVMPYKISNSKVAVTREADFDAPSDLYTVGISLHTRNPRIVSAPVNQTTTHASCHLAGVNSQPLGQRVKGIKVMIN